MAALIRHEPQASEVQRKSRPVYRVDPLDVFERAFGELLGDAGVTGISGFGRVDLYETENEMVLELAVPGATKGNVEIRMEAGSLTVKVEPREMSEEGRRYYLREIPRTTVVRSMALPQEIEIEKVRASVGDGIITLVLPKAETARARVIPVESA